MSIDNKVIERANQRLSILLPQFKKAIREEDLAFAQSLILDIQPLMKTIGKTALLIEFKNSLFEVAINKGQYTYAIEGLIVNRKIINKRTRLNLDAATLLAVAYLRSKDIQNAKPYIREVLQNNHVIKSEATRRKFNEEIIKRFDEESAFYSLQSDTPTKLNEEEFTKYVQLEAASKSEEELFNELGYHTPKQTKDILFEVDQFSKKQLDYKEQKLLLPSEVMITNEKAGKTIFSSVKRAIYNSICDPNSDIYKNWKSNIIGNVFDRNAVIAVISGILAVHGISYVLIVGVGALLLKLGLDIYCKNYKPVGITELRRKK